jgi:hypothetical protein
LTRKQKAIKKARETHARLLAAIAKIDALPEFECSLEMLAWRDLAVGQAKRLRAALANPAL